MNSRPHYTLVGLFVLVLGVVLIAGVLWLGAGTPGRGYDTYVVYMHESVAGLSRDSAVKYRGVDVGRVRALALDPSDTERVRLLLQIDAGTPIREDTVATLEIQGLTGLAYINLSGGTHQSPPLKAAPGEPYPVIRSRASVWGRLDRSLGELVDNLIGASARLVQLLDTPNQEHIKHTLANLETLSGTLAARSAALGQSLDDLERTLGGTRAASERLPALIQRFERSAAALERMAKDIGDAGVAMRRTLESGGREWRGFASETLPQASAAVSALRQSAEHLRRFSAALERDPAVLWRGPAAPAPGPGE